MNAADTNLANQLAADIEEAMAHVDNLAMPGTYLHQQLISATLYENLPKIRALIRAARANGEGMFSII